MEKEEKIRSLHQISRSIAMATTEQAPSPTHLYDLPEAILTNIFSLVTDTRSRNAMALVCHKWCSLERSTRTTLALRGNVHDIFYLLPTCFAAVTTLDLSLYSPWGTALEDSTPTEPFLIAHRLRQAFPNLTSLALYARTPATLQLLAPLWPCLHAVKLVRWHQRALSPVGSDLVPLFESCPSLTSLDLSDFYCWTEDLPTALQACPASSAGLTQLNLLSISTEGFKSQELLAIAEACPNLEQFLAACVFDPRYMDFVGDDAILSLAQNCSKLNLLHLVDASALSGARGNPDDDGFTAEDARITRQTLEELFTGLPLLEDLNLDICHNVRDTGPVLEVLSSRCKKLRSLKLGQFHGMCRPVGSSQLDGVALCAGLESLAIKNSADLNDYSLVQISIGCSRLVKLDLQGCKGITEMGLKKLAWKLRQTLREVRISCCKNLDAQASLRAMEPISDRIQRLHIDCVWEQQQPSNANSEVERLGKTNHDFDLRFIENYTSEENSDFLGEDELEDGRMKKKCRFSGSSESHEGVGSSFQCKTWKRLRYLSLWISVGNMLDPLVSSGLDCCPALEEIKIRVEGDCRQCALRTSAFGLRSLTGYPRLSKMQLDCGDVIGYALSAPSGQMDLSLWERFYLSGIGDLNLCEMDYWPPQDRDMNRRSLSLPAAGWLSQCSTLRKLFIHGTAHEHFMQFTLRIANLRDVQLREDYYPAPENDMSTEMRVDSCRRFEDALNKRPISD